MTTVDPHLIDDDEVALAFLKTVLPPTGFYAAVSKIRNGFHQKIVPTIEELWDVLREGDRDGHDVYFTTASLKSNASRDGKNVATLRAFRLDIDCGAAKAKEGKGYADWKSAVAAIIQFCKDAGLGLPWPVLSGHGVHFYWPLTEPVEPDVWAKYARGLKRACIKYGLRADPVVTTDVARILRPPFTHNRKDKSKPMKVQFPQKSLKIGPYDLTAFDCLLANDNDESTEPSTNVIPFRTIYNEAWEVYYSSALSAIPSDDRDTWFRFQPPLYWRSALTYQLAK